MSMKAKYSPIPAAVRDEEDQKEKIKFERASNPWSSEPSCRQLLSPDVEYQNAILRERDEEIAQIERDMRELHHVWTELALLVERGAEPIENIHTTIENSLKNVEKAKEEVAKANKEQIKSRKTSAAAVGAGAGVGALIIGLLTLKFIH